MSISKPMLKNLAAFLCRLGPIANRRRKWVLPLLLAVNTSVGCIRFRNDALTDGGVDSGATVDAPEDTGAMAEGGDAVVIPGPVCDRYRPGIAESIAGDLITELVADCRLRRYFTSLPPIAVTHLQECLSAQIGQVMGCKHPNGEHYRYPTNDSKGQFCRDMKSSHMGLSTSDGDFDAFVADLRNALEDNMLTPDDVMRVAGVFGATRNDIVRIKEAGPTLPCDAVDASAPDSN
ncbi:MAG: hypothetical protein ABW133_01250 [Polyangiaceae bacterium]